MNPRATPTTHVRLLETGLSVRADQPLDATEARLMCLVTPAE